MKRWIVVVDDTDIVYHENRIHHLHIDSFKMFVRFAFFVTV